MNPVLILSRNTLELTRRCVESIRKQDIPTRIFVIDNGSRDGSMQWAESEGILLDAAPTNTGFSAAVNHGLAVIFAKGAEWCLVPNSDTELAPWTYREVLSTHSGFVTGASWDKLDAVMSEDNHWHGELTAGPDFSCFLVSRAMWETVGELDRDMGIYCSDVDYDIRARRMGITLHNSHIKFFHNRSSTLRLASAGDRAAIKAQADHDHLVFKARYGMMPGDPGQEKLWEV